MRSPYILHDSTELQYWLKINMACVAMCIALFTKSERFYVFTNVVHELYLKMM